MNLINWAKFSFLVFLERNKSASSSLVHYTSAENAFNIIRSKKIWLRNARMMTDYSEIYYGLSLIREAYRERLKRGDLNKLFTEITSRQISLMDFMLDDKEIEKNILNYTYIASLSEHKADRNEDRYGRLSMWRAFGGNKSSVALVIDRNCVQSTPSSVFLSPVEYYERDQVNLDFDKIIDKISEEKDFLTSIHNKDDNVVSNFIYKMVMFAITCLKHPAFKEECEWRVVYNNKIFGNPDDGRLVQEVEIIAGQPQLITKLDIDIQTILKKIIIGPVAQPNQLKDALIQHLKNNCINFPHEYITISNIPLR